MFDSDSFIYTLLIVFALALLLWIASLVKKDVSIVDSFWSLMILAAAISFMFFAETALTDKHVISLLLLTLWALRLAAHISWRNSGKGEDRRYQAIRKNNQPNFEIKSLYIVFLLQAFLAVIVALPMMTVFGSVAEMQLLDYLAVLLWLTGMLFESISDLQLARFKAVTSNKHKILNTGLWRYSRHPNYFGEFLIWWAFFLLAVTSGHWWSIVSPLLMTLLLLKVSGVSLLERSISERHPEYTYYRQTTSAFFPWFPKKQRELQKQE